MIVSNANLLILYFSHFLPSFKFPGPVSAEYFLNSQSTVERGVSVLFIYFGDQTIAGLFSVPD